MARGIRSEMHRKMKITLWLDPAEYWQMMKMSTTLASGNLSMHKFIKAQLGLVKPKEAQAPHQAIHAIVKKMVPYISHEQQEEKDKRSVALVPYRRQEQSVRAAARKPRRSPRRLAA